MSRIYGLIDGLINRNYINIFFFHQCSYGDRCPKSKPARAFAIVWLLISTVLLSFIMAAMSSTLTATVVRSQKKDFNIDRKSKASSFS